jgi:hypothetical protein
VEAGGVASSITGSSVTYAGGGGGGGYCCKLDTVVLAVVHWGWRSRR